MKQLNKDIKRRDEIIFGAYEPDQYNFGGTRDFKNISIATLKQLIDENFIDVDSVQGSSPTVQELLDFAEKWKDSQYEFSGYVVSDERTDYRVSITEIWGYGTYETFIEEDEFEDLASDATDHGRKYAWWE